METPRSRPSNCSDDLLTPAVNLADYLHSPVHLLVAKNDFASLRRIPSHSPSLDRRDVPRGETPLHLAVRLGRSSAASILLSAGADPSLQDSSGWTPFQESLLLRRPRSLSLLLLRHHHLSALHKWRLRLPSLLSALRCVPNFYLELSFRFESSVIPPFLLARAAPSDTYRIWKRAASVRADTSLAGFDGLRIARADRTFLFLGDDNGSLLVLDHDRREVRDALEGVTGEMTPAEEEELVGEEAAAKVYRPGVDVTRAEVVPRTNWRKKEKVEMVGEWKAKVYDVDNVVFTLKSRKAISVAPPFAPAAVEDADIVLDADEDGFLVAEMPPRHSCCEPMRREGMVELEFGGGRRRSVDAAAPPRVEWDGIGGGGGGGRMREKETVKNLRPTVWLTEDFPLKTEEVVPLLDVLADKVKAVRRIRELLTAKFPAGTFPVKLAIPVVPTVRVVVTFSKFVELPAPKEQFFTPPSSPRQFADEEDAHQKAGHETKSSWLRWTTNTSTKGSSNRLKAVSPSPQESDAVDPFAVPKDYAWVSCRSKTPKRSKSRKGSHKGRMLAV